MIYKEFISLMQVLNTYGSAYLLQYLKTEFIEKIELESDSEKIYRDTIDKIKSYIEKCNKNIEAHRSMMEMREVYAEAYIFSKLKSRLAIRKVKERAAPTPDFEISFRSQVFYAELKTVHSVYAETKAKELAERMLEANIQAREALDGDAKVVSSGWIVMDALERGGVHSIDDSDYEPKPRSIKSVIEGLIDKIANAIKSGQFEMGETILIVDFGNDRFTHYPPELSITEHHADVCLNDRMVSGELWHVACGRMGIRLHDQPDMDGTQNSADALEREGILVAYPWVQGLVFHIKDEFYSICRVRRSSEPDTHSANFDVEGAQLHDVDIAALLEYASKKCAVDFY